MKVHAALLMVVALVGCAGDSPKSDLTYSNRPSLTPEENDVLLQSLRQSADELLKAIRNADEESFLALCSRETVEIGADNEVKYKDLKEAMETRDLYYCQYFDIGCLQEKLRDVNYKPSEDLYGRKPLPVSYRELLNRVAGLEISYEIRRPETTRLLGVVVLRWKSPRPRDLGLFDFVEFVFQHKDGRWYLIRDSSPW